MSKIGKQIINIPAGVVVTASGNEITVQGPKGELKYVLPTGVSLVQDNGQVKIELVADGESSLHGLARSLVNNMVLGVTTGWKKTLELNGTGYRAVVAGDTLQLALGFSHPINIKAPTGIGFEVRENKVIVAGFDKIMVGQVAATIRATRPADPYKLKGFKYEGEYIMRKAGKAAKAGATAAK